MVSNNFKKSLKWLLHHAITVISCVIIIVLGIAALTYATTIGDDISTANITISGNATTTGNLIVSGNATTTGVFNVTGNTTLAGTTLSGNLDMSLKQIKNVVLEKLSSAPSSPTEGRMYWNTTTKTPYWYDADNSRWRGLNATPSSVRIITVGPTADYDYTTVSAAVTAAGNSYTTVTGTGTAAVSSAPSNEITGTSTSWGTGEQDKYFRWTAGGNTQAIYKITFAESDTSIWTQRDDPVQVTVSASAYEWVTPTWTVIKVAPGSYSGTVTLKPFVLIEGSGKGVTNIGTVNLAADAVEVGLSNLTIQGNSDYAAIDFGYLADEPGSIGGYYFDHIDIRDTAIGFAQQEGAPAAGYKSIDDIVIRDSDIQTEWSGINLSWADKVYIVGNYIRVQNTQYENNGGVGDDKAAIGIKITPYTPDGGYEYLIANNFIYVSQDSDVAAANGMMVNTGGSTATGAGDTFRFHITGNRITAINAGNGNAYSFSSGNAWAGGSGSKIMYLEGNTFSTSGSGTGEYTDFNVTSGANEGVVIWTEDNFNLLAADGKPTLSTATVGNIIRGDWGITSTSTDAYAISDHEGLILYSLADASADETVVLPSPYKGNRVVITIAAPAGGSNYELDIAQNSSEQIQGAASTYNAQLRYEGDSITLIADGTDWYIESSYPYINRTYKGTSYLFNFVNSGTGGTFHAENQSSGYGVHLTNNFNGIGLYVKNNAGATAPALQIESKTTSGGIALDVFSNGGTGNLAEFGPSSGTTNLRINSSGHLQTIKQTSSLPTATEGIFGLIDDTISATENAGIGGMIQYVTVDSSLNSYWMQLEGLQRMAKWIQYSDFVTSPDDTNGVALGVIPEGVFITNIYTDEQTAFATCTTATITIGFDGTNNKFHDANYDYMANSDMNELTMSATTGFRGGASSKSLEIYGTYTGSACTAGKALIVLEYYRVPFQP